MSTDPTRNTLQQEHLADLLNEDITVDPPVENSWPEPPALPVPVDPATEQAAFVELLTLMAATDDSDGDTLITALSADAFGEESFTPLASDLDPTNPEDLS